MSNSSDQWSDNAYRLHCRRIQHAESTAVSFIVQATVSANAVDWIRRLNGGTFGRILTRNKR
jgi:hypothetical protein